MVSLPALLVTTQLLSFVNTVVGAQLKTKLYPSMTLPALPSSTFLPQYPVGLNLPYGGNVALAQPGALVFQRGLQYQQPVGAVSAPSLVELDSVGQAAPDALSKGTSIEKLALIKEFDLKVKSLLKAMDLANSENHNLTDKLAASSELLEQREAAWKHEREVLEQQVDVDGKEINQQNEKMTKMAQQLGGVSQQLRLKASLIQAMQKNQNENEVRVIKKAAGAALHKAVGVAEKTAQKTMQAAETRVRQAAQYVVQATQAKHEAEARAEKAEKMARQIEDEAVLEVDRVRAEAASEVNRASQQATRAEAAVRNLEQQVTDAKDRLAEELDLAQKKLDAKARQTQNQVVQAEQLMQSMYLNQATAATDTGHPALAVSSSK